MSDLFFMPKPTLTSYHHLYKPNEYTACAQNRDHNDRVIIPIWLPSPCYTSFLILPYSTYSISHLPDSEFDKSQGRVGNSLGWTADSVKDSSMFGRRITGTDVESKSLLTGTYSGL